MSHALSLNRRRTGKQNGTFSCALPHSNVSEYALEYPARLNLNVYFALFLDCFDINYVSLCWKI